MPVTKSSKLYLERAGFVPTHRGPLPRMTPGDINIHDAELARPLPLSEFVSNGVPPPDRSSTAAPDPWPHGPPEDS